MGLHRHRHLRQRCRGYANIDHPDGMIIGRKLGHDLTHRRVR